MPRAEGRRERAPGQRGGREGGGAGGRTRMRLTAGLMRLSAMALTDSLVWLSRRSISFSSCARSSRSRTSRSAIAASCFCAPSADGRTARRHVSASRERKEHGRSGQRPKQRHNAVRPRLFLDLQQLRLLLQPRLLLRRLPVRVRGSLLRRQGGEGAPSAHHRPRPHAGAPTLSRTARRRRVARASQASETRPGPPTMSLLCASCTSASRSPTLIASSACSFLSSVS